MKLTLKRDPEDKQMFHLRYIQPNTSKMVILFGTTHFDCLFDTLRHQLTDDEWEELESGAGSVDLELKVIRD